MVRAAPAPLPERGFLLGRLSNAGLTVPRPAPRQRPSPKPFTIAVIPDQCVLASSNEIAHENLIFFPVRFARRGWTHGDGSCRILILERHCRAEVGSKDSWND